MIRGIPANARPAIRSAPDTWRRYLAICDAIENEDELTVEEFAPFSALFNDLIAAGVPFDAGFVDRVRGLQSSLVGTDLDADMDGYDELLTERELECDELCERDDLSIDENIDGAIDWSDDADAYAAVETDDTCESDDAVES